MRILLPALVLAFPFTAVAADDDPVEIAPPPRVIAAKAKVSKKVVPPADAQPEPEVLPEPKSTAKVAPIAPPKVEPKPEPTSAVKAEPMPVPAPSPPTPADSKEEPKPADAQPATDAKPSAPPGPTYDRFKDRTLPLIAVGCFVLLAVGAAARCPCKGNRPRT